MSRERKQLKENNKAAVKKCRARSKVVNFFEKYTRILKNRNILPLPKNVKGDVRTYVFRVRPHFKERNDVIPHRRV